MVLLTRQPTEGRARHGGLRCGNMETECIASHGMAHFFKERFMECSDAFGINACKSCGAMVSINVDVGVHGVHECSCGNSTRFANLTIPYASKLALQEVGCMGVAMRLFGRHPADTA